MTDADRKRIKEANLALATTLNPEPVFRFFAELAAIPRCSGNMELVADYLEAFAAKRGLACARDATDNVIISKKGSRAGAGVILQAHQDMVCVKDEGVEHDFSADPIELVARDNGQSDGWLRARGTTLGADDGIGVALALAVLDDPAIPHPPLEALFTVDEETDMKGAKAVLAEQLKGGTLINLDAEDLGIAYVSSAAGAGLTIDLPLDHAAERPEGAVWRMVKADGLQGGHSGLEINKNRANAYVLLARFLAAASEELPCAVHSLAQGEGHGADNAIPDRAVALVSLDSARDADRLEELAAAWTKVFKNEHRASDPCLQLRTQTARDAGAAPFTEESRDRLLALIRLLPLGVFRFSQSDRLMDTPYKNLLVESSCNLGIADAANGRAELRLLARSSTASVLDDMTARLNALARMAGGALTVNNRTAGWEMPAQATPVQVRFQKQGLTCLGVHAGLECGCLVETFVRAKRTLDAVSIGPTLKDVHSPKERLHIASVEAVWKQLLAVLATL